MRENAFLTPDKARELGLAFDEPEPMRCRWCGKELTPLGAELLGRVRWVTTEPCRCEGERAGQERIEREKRRARESEVVHKVAAAGVARRFAGARTSIPEVVRFLADFDAHGPGRAGQDYTDIREATHAEDYLLAKGYPMTSEIGGTKWSDAEAQAVTQMAVWLASGTAETGDFAGVDLPWSRPQGASSERRRPTRTASPPSTAPTPP
mgnify:CR=1 FL=1